MKTSPNKKTKAINFRVTLAEHGRIKRAAASYGLTMTEFVNRCATALSTKRCAQLPDIDKDVRKEFRNA